MSRQEDPTEVERKVLQFIYWTTISTGYPPSFVEIAKHFTWGKNNKTPARPSQVITRLQAKGFVTKGPKRAGRTTRLTDAGKQWAQTICLVEVRAAKVLGQMLHIEQETN